jgi:hypothetical protein
MKTISELLVSFNNRLVLRNQSTEIIINSIKLVTGALIKTNDIILKEKKITLKATVSGPIKTIIFLKKETIIKEINKNSNLDIKTIN